MIWGLKSFFTVCVLSILPGIGIAQVSLAPQANFAPTMGYTREYGSSRMGYGLEAGYQATPRWQIVVAYDRYRFGLSAGRERLNINATLAALLNPPETILLDLTTDTWSGGVRYRWPLAKTTPYVGVDGSTNRITAEGYGLRISRRYWGVAPVLGVERSVAKRWSVQLDARLQTIFIQENIPFVEEFFRKYLVFVPIRVGVVFRPSISLFSLLKKGSP